MTEVTFSELTRVRDIFSSIPQGRKPEKSSGQCAYRTYKFEEASKVPIYPVNNISDTDICTFYKKIMKPDVKEINEEDFMTMVNISLLVKDPIDRTKYLMKFPADAEVDPDRANRKPSKTSRIQFTVPKTAARVLEVVPDEVLQQPMVIESHETTSEQADAICFVFAWTMRFSIKSVSNSLALQLKTMRESYLKFFNRSSEILDGYNPNPEWFKGIQIAFGSFPIVKNTLAIVVAVSDTGLKGSPKQFNLARYLFFQNLEFMGMHSYVSVVKITNKVAAPPGLVLTWLRMQGMEDAVEEIGKIMMNLDNGMIDDGDKRERLWKYARMIDEGYFNRMQTAYSPELVAVLAFIEIFLGISTKGGYNSPLNIFAIKNNESLLKKGEEKAKVFMECLGSLTALDKDASMIDRIYAKRQGGIIIKEGTTKDQHGSTEKQPIIVENIQKKRKADEEPPSKSGKEGATPPVPSITVKIPPRFNMKPVTTEPDTMEADN
ncbi:MAG: nucleocapsid [Betanucleorhabdovirus picridis]|uniref:Nucleoprotein n=1 Tax=Picris betanucleorhabdovirus 1 TaxID=2950849 RepID=A0AAE9SG65_9RHAB|nr:MAG: nucleocapsid [Picris betanucleorhabdovirus 1]UTQ50632.1 MAG: nucleocapsid [Picris betanucleorhabdovirus 1]